MKNTYLSLPATDFKCKFNHFCMDLRKIKALDNLSKVDDFAYKNHLELLKLCLETDFLEKEEASFLDFMLKKYEIDWRHWAYKTPWLKKTMRDRKQTKLAIEERARKQLEFSFTRTLEMGAKKIPVELLTKTNLREIRR